jgi:beta-lactamase class D
MFHVMSFIARRMPEEGQKFARIAAQPDAHYSARVIRMKRFAPTLVMLLAGLNAGAEETAARPEWRRHFEAQGARGTFVLYEAERRRYLVYDEARAKRGYLPASTFKIPNALIGLEVGSIRDEKEVFRWDGKPQLRKALEQDHTLDTGMRDSVVWMFQEVARRTGKTRMREWLQRFDYGNADIRGGLEHFWLQGSLRVSAMQQVEFLRKLEEGRLPVSARSRRLVRDALRIEEWGVRTLYAKTGTTGRVQEPVMWWIGWVEEEGRMVAAFALNIDLAKDTKPTDRYAIARAILKEARVLR